MYNNNAMAKGAFSNSKYHDIADWCTTVNELMALA
jgi:hypothetical protein